MDTSGSTASTDAGEATATDTEAALSPPLPQYKPSQRPPHELAALIACISGIADRSRLTLLQPDPSATLRMFGAMALSIKQYESGPFDMAALTGQPRRCLVRYVPLAPGISVEDLEQKLLDIVTVSQANLPGFAPLQALGFDPQRDCLLIGYDVVVPAPAIRTALQRLSHEQDPAVSALSDLHRMAQSAHVRASGGGVAVHEYRFDHGTALKIAFTCQQHCVSAFHGISPRPAAAGVRLGR